MGRRKRMISRGFFMRFIDSGSLIAFLKARKELINAGVPAMKNSAENRLIQRAGIPKTGRRRKSDRSVFFLLMIMLAKAIPRKATRRTKGKAVAKSKL